MTAQLPICTARTPHTSDSVPRSAQPHPYLLHPEHTCQIGGPHGYHTCSTCFHDWAVEHCTGTVFDGETARECILPSKHTGECVRACGHRRKLADGFHWCVEPFDHDGDHGDRLGSAWLKHSRLSRAGLEAVAADVLDAPLTPWQLDVAERILAGESIHVARQGGKSGIRKLLAAVTAPPCGVRSVLGFTCDVPNTTPHDYHISTDPAYPAQPHQWRTSTVAGVEFTPARKIDAAQSREAAFVLRELAERLDDVVREVGYALDMAHEAKRVELADTVLDDVLLTIDRLADGWAQLAQARQRLRATGY